jgi:serine protease Do
MKTLRFLCFSFAVALASLEGATVKDREGAIRQDKATMENDARWIYNDVDRGFAQAKRTGKPLLVVLRCVPCLSCVGLDAEVLNDRPLQPLLDLFVCVRLINANAIDLARFQFDYDLSFTTMFFNGDGTVYGRYGSWVHQADPEARETIGYRRALEGVLALHRGYPQNRGSLAGKQGLPTPFRTPVEIPALAKKYGRELNWGGNVGQSCVHCHQVGEAFRAYDRDRGDPVPEERIYPMPAPETIGLTLAPDHAATVVAVAPGSAAAEAGFQAGDSIAFFGGQPLVSVADFAWALHGAPAEGVLRGVVQRDGLVVPVTLPLSPGWRTKSDISRRVGTWSMRAMALGGMVLTDLDDAARTERGLGREGLALFVKGLGNHGQHGTAKKAGFQKDDVIVALDGISARTTEGDVIGQLLRKRKAGETVNVTVRRGGERVSLKLPMQ